MRSWVLAIALVACGGDVKKPVAVGAAPPTCRAAIEGSWARMGKTGNVDTAVEMCERHHWSADVRSCLGKAASQADLGECGKLLPPEATDAIDDIARASAGAVAAVERFADRVCACKSFDCVAAIIDEAVRYTKTMPAIIPRDVEASQVAEARLMVCAANYPEP